MRKSFWLSIITTLGWLTLCSLGLAQTPESKVVPRQSPSTEIQIPRATHAPPQQPQSVIPLPFPVQVIKDSKEEEAARNSEKKSEKHDAEDLEAQRKAADAAERSAISAEWQEGATIAQIVFAVLGTIGLLVSLGFTWKALSQARDTDHRTLRAYMSAHPIFLYKPEKDGTLMIKIKMENFGQTFALNVRTNSAIDLFSTPLPANFEIPKLSDFRTAASTIAPRQDFGFTARSTRKFTADDLRDVSEGRVAIVVWGVLDYLDVFGNPWVSEFSARVVGSPDDLRIVLLTADMRNVAIAFESIGQHNNCT